MKFLFVTSDEYDGSQTTYIIDSSSEKRAKEIFMGTLLPMFPSISDRFDDLAEFLSDTLDIRILCIDISNSKSLS